MEAEKIEMMMIFTTPDELRELANQLEKLKINSKLGEQLAITKIINQKTIIKFCMYVDS